MRFRNFTRLTGLASLCAGCLLASPSAEAGLVNLIFGGLIDAGGVPSELGSMIMGNDAFSGTIQYDDSTAADAGGNSSLSSFHAITDFSFDVNSGAYASTGFTQVAIPGSNIQVYNDLGAPDYDHISFVPFADGLAAPALNGYNFFFAVLRLDDLSETVFGTAAALPSSVDLPDFDSGNFYMYFMNDAGDFQGINATLTYLRTVTDEEPVVPEPATLSLIGLGMGGLGLMRRRRKAAIVD